MALPIAGAVARKFFRDARGRFISKAKHELLGRQSIISGRFLTKDAAVTERARESEFRKILKAPPAGQTWVKIAEKYSERFADLSAQVNSAL